MPQHRLLAWFFDVRPGERRIAALMCLYFFLVITSFWILKPLKKALFIGHYADAGFAIAGFQRDAPEAELLAKILNMVVAAVAVVAFSFASRTLRRQRLTYLFTGFFIASYGVFALWLVTPTGPAVWSFYLLGDLFSTLMVATFFSFLNDSVTPDLAKRIYGVVGFGGVAGGAFGASAVSVWIGTLSLPAWLGVAAAVGVVIVLVAGAAAASLPPQVARRQAEDDRRAAEDPGNPALAGARLVLRSGYLAAIVAIVGLYEIVSTILDFQFTSAVFQLAESDAARDQHYATVYAITNWLAMFVQLFLTSFVMRRFGLATALMVLPGAIALSSAGFLLAPTLWIGSLLSISDNALNYSLNQSSKEALYVPTTVEEKYQAKAFIDMFVQRFAKALGVGVGLAAGASVSGLDGIRLLSLVVVPLVLLWGAAAVYAGRRFARLTEDEPDALERAIG